MLQGSGNSDQTCNLTITRAKTVNYIDHWIRDAKLYVYRNSLPTMCSPSRR